MVPGFWSAAGGLGLDGDPSFQWVQTVAFAERVLRVPLAPGAAPGACAAIDHRVASIAPAAVSGATLVRMLQHSSSLVSFTALRLLALQCARLAAFCADAAGAGQDGDTAGRVREGVRRRLPGVEAVLAAQHRAFGRPPHTADLPQLVTLRCLRHYRAEFSEQFRTANVDVGRLLLRVPDFWALDKRVQREFVLLCIVSAHDSGWITTSGAAAPSHLRHCLRCFLFYRPSLQAAEFTLHAPGCTATRQRAVPCFKRCSSYSAAFLRGRSWCPAGRATRCCGLQRSAAGAPQPLTFLWRCCTGCSARRIPLCSSVLAPLHPSSRLP